MEIRPTTSFALAERSLWRGHDETPFVGVGARRAVEIESDRRLVAEIERATRAAGYASLRHLDVSACNACVVLSGVVPSYFMKQLAQEMAMRVANVQVVNNELEVRQP